MTSTHIGLALLFVIGCTRVQPASVTVVTAIPKAQTPVAIAAPEESFGCAIYAKDAVSEDAAAFRKCIEAAVATETPCDGGSSPDLPTLELAVMLIDGAGGPADVPRARTLLASCFRDESVKTVLAHADAKAKDSAVKALGSCSAFAMTTLASTDCITEHITNEHAWLAHARRTYGIAARPFFDDATRAANAYARKVGEILYTLYATGTMRGPAMQSKILEVMQARHVRLEAIQTWSPKPMSDEERVEARRHLSQALRSLEHDAEPELVTAVRAEEDAWAAYRDAEVALYEQIHRGSHDVVAMELARQHAKEVCEMTVDP